MSKHSAPDDESVSDFVSDPTSVAAPLITVRSLVKSYRREAETVHAVRSVDLTVRHGQVIALIGPSGSGKSTLLNVLCGWERPDEGELELAPELGATRPADVPWGRVALVPQALGLLEEMSIYDNILMPARLTKSLAEMTARAEELMTEFGIDHLTDRYPTQVSLGEQQRAAVARALLLHPLVVLADEPSAHQDSGWADVLFGAFARLAREGSACLIATHNPAVWERADSVLAMKDGELVAHNTAAAHS